MGKSSSQANTTTTTTYTTNYSTRIGDIGFTGKDALAFERNLLDYGLQSQRIMSNELKNLTTSFIQLKQGIPVASASNTADSGDNVPPTPPLFTPQNLIIAASVAAAAAFLFWR